MKNLLIELGLFFLAPIEKISHAIQWLTGRDNFAQAKYVTYITQAIIWGIMAIFLFFAYKLGWPLLAVLFLDCICYIASLILGPTYRIKIKKAEDAMQPGVRNPLQICPNDSWERIFWMVVGLLFLAMGRITGPFFLSHAMSCHLRACTPLPPCSGKVKEWWNKMRSSKDEPVPEGAGA